MNLTLALTRCAVGAWSIVFLVHGVSAAELARFEIKEPLGVTWTDEWLTERIELNLGGRSLPVSALAVRVGSDVVPAQFYDGKNSRLLADNETLNGRQQLKVLFHATVPRQTTVVVTVTDGAPAEKPWAIRVSENEGRRAIHNGEFVVTFDPSVLLPLNEIRAPGGSGSLGTFSWPPGVQLTRVDEEWLERGPARVILQRAFAFADADSHYTITFTIRAGDPWIDVVDSGELRVERRSAGASGRETDSQAQGELGDRSGGLQMDLRALEPDTVFHPYAYNARTFSAGGPQEDSTLQPPQHPIATLGPIWRDIWYNGGPFAFVYRTNADYGLGFAAVRGSQWRTAPGVTPESQNLEIHGEREQPGQVFVRLPVDGVISRHWAIIVGPPALRKSLGRLTRSHADIPLDMLRHEWILEWPSDAPSFNAGAAGAYLGGPFNQHFFNPTTYPRTVSRQVNSAFKRARHVKSRDLAVLAYVFSNPDYWPGPDYPWRIGNPNFHTDMYNIVLKIGLLMPDHPHAARWVNYGVKETWGNLMRDSYPGGAWAESLSYAGFFYHVAENVALLRDYGVTNGFEHWPRLRECATYLAAMHTPVDPRYGTRQKAPIGDTGPGDYYDETRALAKEFRGIDERFAEQLARFPEAGANAFDFRSRAFPGFGAMFRGNAYDDAHESFVTIKAGPARNHYQGDELAFHFCSLGTPLLIDHACHYSPRPWSASIHNRPDMNGKRPVAIAEPRAFQASALADVFVADERTTRINEVPMEPHHCTKPGWEYPTTFLPEAKAWTMRRYVMLVKHDPAQSKLADYLVVRDEINSPEPVWWNLHPLARSIEGNSPVFHFPGQLGVDLGAHFLAPALSRIEKREWGWSGNGGKRRTVKGAAYEEAFFGQIIPEDFERGTWKADNGEHTMWLRAQAAAGPSEWLVVLMPRGKKQPAPTVEKVSATSARITLGDETEIVHLGTAGTHQAAIERNGRLTVLLKAGAVPPWGELEFKPLPGSMDRGAR